MQKQLLLLSLLLIKCHWLERSWAVYSRAAVTENAFRTLRLQKRVSGLNTISKPSCDISEMTWRCQDQVKIASKRNTLSVLIGLEHSKSSVIRGCTCRGSRGGRAGSCGLHCRRRQPRPPYPALQTASPSCPERSTTYTTKHHPHQTCVIDSSLADAIDASQPLAFMSMYCLVCYHQC